MRIFLSAIYLMFLITGCTKSGFVIPKPTESNYLKTTGGGFLLENRGSICVCKYILALKVIKDLPVNALLEINFENPDNKYEPIVINYVVIPDQKEIDLKSTDIINLKPYKAYKVIVKIYSDQSKSQLIGEHSQLIRSEVDLKYINKKKGGHKITEPWEFSFDERKWRLGFIQAIENTKIIEYVPSGETIDNWSELVTSYTILQQVNLKDLVEVIHNKVINNYSSPKWNTIELKNNFALYEWSHQGGNNLSPEYYLTRYHKSEEYVYSLTYAIKTNDISENQRNNWIKLLTKASIKE